MSTWPGSTVWLRLPATAISRPRFSLRISDSCGKLIAGEVRFMLSAGFDGSFMSSTRTPRLPSPTLVGGSSEVS